MAETQNGVPRSSSDQEEDVALASTIFARLHPATYLSRFLTNGIRPDGRTFDACRPVTVGRSTIDSAEGSCIVRLGNTVVIAGVKAELLDTSDEQFEDDLLIAQDTDRQDERQPAGLHGLGPIDRRRVVVGVDLAPMSSARFRPGPPGEEAQVLASRVMRTLDACPPLSASSLQIQRGELSWCLYVDVVCIAYDGNPLDAVLLAVNGALHDVRLPFDLQKADVRRPLKLTACPLSFSFAIVENRHLLSDANAFEASMTSATLTIVLQADQDIQDKSKLVEVHCAGLITALVSNEEAKANKINGSVEEGAKEGLIRVQDEQLIRLCIARAKKQYLVHRQAMQQARQPS